MGDLLEGAQWECAEAPPGTAVDAVTGWIPAIVPGTAAQARLSAGRSDAWTYDYDESDWWFRVTVDGAVGPHLLGLDGLATLADVWLDGEHVLHSENMFVAHTVPVTLRAGGTLVLRFASLSQALRGRFARPRWRTGRIRDNKLRWFRTTLLGRMSGWPLTPAPVGPWRPVTLTPAPEVRVRSRTLATDYDCATGAGRLDVRVELEGVDGPVSVSVAGVTGTVVNGAATIELSAVDAWWPATHGGQPLYDVTLDAAGRAIPLGRVGFRSVGIDRADGAFTLVWNGVPIFCRGANWFPLDPVNLAVAPERTRANVRLVVDGNMNMLRSQGPLFYEDAAFLDACDELGVLLWQDAMFAFVDVPDDPELEASVTTELRGVFERLSGRPCLAVVCGGGDTEEQALYHGQPLDALSSRVPAEVIPALVDELLPRTPYVRATPGESEVPTVVDEGVSHYFGVGAYLRPVADTRSARVRFAAECLPFSTPPEPMDPLVEESLYRGQGHLRRPRDAAYTDTGAALYDFESVRDAYLEELFGESALRLRFGQPERFRQLARATTYHLFEQTLSEWRRAGSTCEGALAFYGHDLRHGQDMGLVDVLDRPKAGWYAMRHVMAPQAVLLTDEGFNGLGVHVVNDAAVPFEGTVRVDLWADGSRLTESASLPVAVPARGGVSLSTAAAFGSFRDLSYAHRFGDPVGDPVVLTLLSADGSAVHHATYLPTGPALPLQHDVGLRALLSGSGDVWQVRLGAERFAQWVTFDVPGWRPSDSWLHVLPGEEIVVHLTREPGARGAPRGSAICLNSRRRAPLTTR